MIHIKERLFARYNKPKNHKDPTVYVVPTTIEIFEWHKENLEYYKKDEIINNKNQCIEELVKRRLLLKNFQKSLIDTMYWTKLKLKQYKYDIRNTKPIQEKYYNARVMVGDPEFNPCEATWPHNGTTDPFKGFTDDSPLPLAGQPYWHSVQAIEKSNAWLDLISNVIDTEFEMHYTNPTYSKDAYAKITKSIKDCRIKGYKNGK